jgi:Ca2+-binding EF-hand superfamily protein
MTKRPPKKSDMLEVRIPHETKRAFLEACREVGRTASEVVREFVDSYLSRARRRSSNHEWSVAMILNSPVKRRAALAVGAGALGLVAMVGLTAPSTAQSDLSGAFASIDADGDGRITMVEFSNRNGITAGAAELSLTWGGCPETESICWYEEWWVLGTPPRRGVFDREERVISIRRDVVDGVVESEELTFVENGMQVLAESRSYQFASTDHDGDGVIDLAEYETRYQELIAQEFSAADTNDDGRLTAEEFVPGVREIGQFRTVFGDPRAPRSEAGFRRLDQDGDDGLTLAEFSVGS